MQATEARSPQEAETVRRRVFAGIPRIHGVEWGTAKGIFIQSSTRCHVEVHGDKPMSLLAMGFNQLWCDCLNRIKEFDYWLLCHADITFRTTNWLDMMVDDLERHGLDALHANIDIKDGRGLYSTGVGNALDVWGHVRRLTKKESLYLPSVYQLDDVVKVMARTGHVPKRPVFCPNTGCLLVKVDQKWWWDFPGFNIMDSMESVYIQGHLIRRPRVVPEDWHFGHWMQGRGLKVGGTRRIRIDHVHPHLAYSNDKVDPAGEAVDEGYLFHRRWGRDE